MRIALVGQAAFGADVLKGLLEHGHEVAGVFCPPDRGGRPDTLKEAAQDAGAPVFQPAHMRDPEAYEAMVALKADLGVLAFVTDIIPPQVFNAPKLGSIGYHPSLLPRHRGSSAINWAVIERRNPQRAHHLLGGPGDRHRRHPPAEDGGDRPCRDHRRGLFQQALSPGGGGAPGSSGVDRPGPGPPDSPGPFPRHLRASLRRTGGRTGLEPAGRAVFNFIRGCDPQPGATTTFRGEKVKLYNAAFLEESHQAAAGEILEVSERGLKLAVAGGVIVVGRFRTKELGKVKAPEFIAAKQPQPGDKFGSA